MPSMVEWMNSWNEVIRRVIFQDEELKRLMMIPKQTGILDFIEKYFIKSDYTNTILSNENVRIVYGDVNGIGTDTWNTQEKRIVFDIYVKKKELYTATNDRLASRAVLIADRLNKLLTKERYLYGYRFWIGGDYDYGTTTNGYSHMCLEMCYMKVYS